jgi:hypothetical protein
LRKAKGLARTAYLVIKPPKNFGYHNDEKTITISMQPVKYDDYSKKGEITYATFLVESRGFSTPGFESIAFIGALAVVLNSHHISIGKENKTFRTIFNVLLSKGEIPIKLRKSITFIVVAFILWSNPICSQVQMHRSSTDKDSFG